MSFIFSEDAALKALLQGITVSDDKASNRPVVVYFANPDIEERLQTYPYITIELINNVWASDRQTSGVIIDNDAQGTIAPQDNVLYGYEIPVAWDLIYQVTAYSRHPRHDRTIMTYLLDRVFQNNRGFLPVKNDLGTETGYRHMFLREFAKRDVVEEGRRLYRTVFTVSVASEGTAILSDAIAAVQSVEINTTTADIPPGLQIP